MLYKCSTSTMEASLLFLRMTRASRLTSSVLAVLPRLACHGGFPATCRILPSTGGIAQTRKISIHYPHTFPLRRSCEYLPTVSYNNRLQVSPKGTNQIARIDVLHRPSDPTFLHELTHLFLPGQYQAINSIQAHTPVASDTGLELP